MPSITNVGGSLTSAVVLTLIAWAVRFFRAAARKKQGPLQQASGGHTQLGRYFSTLSPAAVHMLVETKPIPHTIIDIRTSEDVEEQALPQDLKGAVRLSVGEVASALTEDGGLWAARAGDTPLPPQQNLLLFIASSPQDGLAAASAACSRGYDRTFALEGSLGAYSKAAESQTDLHWINRDGVALLLGMADGASKPDKVKVLDVRRHDERTLYGCIQGSIPMPVDQLASALQMSGAEWEAAYHCSMPEPQDWLIMQGRTNCRAAWAAQIAHDLGFHKCLVYRQGTYGWRIHPAVKAYRRYEMGDPPPDPEAFQVEHVNVAAGREELLHLGLPFH